MVCQDSGSMRDLEDFRDGNDKSPKPALAKNERSKEKSSGLGNGRGEASRG